MRKNIAIEDAVPFLGADWFDPLEAGVRQPQHRKSNYESRYTLYRLPYEAIAAGQGALRPEIQIETSVWSVRRPPVNRPVISFIAEAFKRDPEVPTIACAAIVESAAEKFVALTRRAGAEFASVSRDRDPTLVRHIYDLYAIREHYDPAEVATLAREVMQDDARTRGDEFPAYRDNPLKETLRAIDLIADDASFAAAYATFRRDMVYGQGPEYEVATAALKVVAESFSKAQNVDMQGVGGDNDGPIANF